MRGASLALALLVCNAALMAAQQSVDTTLTIQGFLQRDNDVGGERSPADGVADLRI